jgi:hypothetical protein
MGLSVCKKKSPFMKALEHRNKVALRGRSVKGYGRSDFNPFEVRNKK